MKFVSFFLRGALILALLAFSGCTPAPKVAITFGGDIILARDAKALFEQIDPWQNVNKAIKDQQGGAVQTFFLANLESPISKNDTKQPDGTAEEFDLCANFETLSVLKQGGINFVNLANNHQNDCNNEIKDAAQGSTSLLVNKAGIQSVGPDLEPSFLETKAGRVGLIGIEDINQPVDEKQLIESVKKIKLKCDILVVSIHWGNEYQNGITDRQKELAQVLADAGVDVLWGTHPHVLQPIQWIKASEGDHKMLAMYSLGNLLADQWMTPQTQQSALITLMVQNKKVVAITVLPLQLDRNSRQLTLTTTDVSQEIKKHLGISELTIPTGN
jgi:gamma-polyglutamate biosynthesis protein CapA